MQKIRRILGIIILNQRQIWAVLMLVAFFGLSSSFPADKITSESCQGGVCEQAIKDPSLTDTNLKFFQNDVFTSNAGEFYRLTFREKSNQDTKIYLKVTDVLDREKPLKSFELKKSEQDNFQEVLFGTDKKYTDFLFEKEKDGAEVLISDLRVTKLNVKNEAELAKIVPTIFGDIDANVISQSQLKNDFVFNQLLEPKIILGQVFRAEKQYITEIEMDFNIVQQGGAGKYEFVFKEAGFEDEIPEIKSGFLTSLKFSPTEVERFRQSNGKFKFPIFQKVTAGEYYFFGINNDRGDVNQFNYLELRGTTDRDSYPNGTAAVKKSGETFPAQGSLYFKIFGIERKEYAGKNILLGETLEDLGGGKIVFKYQPSENQSAVADLDSFTGDISYDEKVKAIVGTVEAKKPSSSLIYKFETPFPFKNLKVFAEKKNPVWLRTKLSYSLDGQKWFSLAEKSDTEAGTQEFDQIIPNVFGKNVLYLKIEPEIGADTFEEKNEWKFGVENLKIEGELRS